jgi:hypothetical protein
MKTTKTLELDLAFNHDHPTFAIEPQPLAKVEFKSADVPGQPYGILDFIEIANRASQAFKSKSKWMRYFDACNSLFLTNKLDVIHRAKSVAALVYLNQFVMTLEEFYSNPYEIVYSQIMPMMAEQVVLHEAYKADSISKFISCLRQIAKFHSRI